MTKRQARPKSKARKAKTKSKKSSSATSSRGFRIKHPLFFPVVTFVTLFFAGLLFFVALGGSTQGARDARIVSVFADGEQQTVTTRADTVGELLTRLEIDVAEEDIIE